MAQNETWLKHDLMKAVRVQYLDGNLFSMDNAGNLIGVTLTRDGEDYAGGGSVSANVIRADGGTVTVTGALSGNAATVVLPQAAYVVPGAVSIVVKLTASGQVTTIAAIVANVYRSSTDTPIDPGTIIPSVQALISAIDTAVASIPADYSSLWASLAPAFSTSSAYTAGQYVTYNGGLYRFTADHAAGAWSSSHVVAVNIGGELSDLKSAIGGSDIDLVNDVTGFYGRVDENGEYYINSSREASRQFSANGAKSIVVTASTRNSMISFLASSVEGLSSGDTPSYATGETGYHTVPAGTTEELTVPTGTNYILATFKGSNVTGWYPSKIYAIYGGLAEKVYDIKIDPTLTQSGQAADAKVTGNKFAENDQILYSYIKGDQLDNFTWENGTFNATNGTRSSDATHIRTSTYLPNYVREISVNDDAYTFSLYAWNAETDEYVGLYDNGVFKTSGFSATGTLIKHYETPITAGYKYAIRLNKTSGDMSVSESNKLTMRIVKSAQAENPCAYVSKREISLFDKMLCIGDSLIEGGANAPDITPDPENAKRTVTLAMYSVPTMISKMFGIQTTNWGISGATSRSWYNYRISHDTDWGGFDSALIYIGSNDYNYVVSDGMTIEEGANTSETYINNIITKLRLDNPGIRVFLCTLNPNTASGNYAQYRLPLFAKIRKIADENDDVFLVDLAKYSSFRGGLPYSNGHPTAVGYQLMAREISSAISWWINSHPSDFEWVRWIGTQYAVVSGTTPGDQEDNGGYGDID